ncbi:hypothetical protein [Zunongwangia endophytica]|uniref:Uncharacterized protein n=1 Tax=Zunongwangia endophytica TaxID=1808945 RepID=A0ABV8HB68_9FLAO|nr:hypothetical protein [Zunongwangia endophytica]MDN3594664.1 hypothetical protein [Zunongwangia endophytica]
MQRIIKIIQSLEFGNPNKENFTFEQVANAFKQSRVSLPFPYNFGGGGNCASIALIKASIGSFGFSGIYNSIIIDNQRKRFLIDLIDDEETTYNLSFENYQFASQKSAFKLNIDNEISRDILEFSNFCYAVMAEVKRRTFRRNKRYRRAVRDLNQGDSTKYIYELLGLEKEKIQDISIENLKNFEHLVLYNPPHAVYSNKGLYDEFFSGHNDIEPLEKLKDIHGNGTVKDNPKGAYILRQ